MDITVDQIPEPNIEPGKVTALVLSDDYSTLGAIREALRDCTSDCQVIATGSLTEFTEQLHSESIDLVAFDLSKLRPQGIIPLYETKLFPNSVGMIVLADSIEPSEFDLITRAGCDRIILKSSGWLHEIRSGIRQILRVRKLQDENQRLVGLLAQANSDLSRRNNRLDEYSSVVAHDIRGLVSNVVMRIDLALEIASKTISKEVKEQLERASSTGHHVVEIVKSSYEFAKLGSESIKQDKTDLNDLLKEVILDLGIDTNQSLKLSFDKLPYMLCSRGLMRRVFLNLISNAIRYNDKEMTEIKISSRPSSEYPNRFELIIEDNGAGISSESRERIFQPYWREPEQRQSSQGLGLGLAIVRRIIDLHQGEVRVESEKAQFTRFILSFPNTRTCS